MLTVTALETARATIRGEDLDFSTPCPEATPLLTPTSALSEDGETVIHLSFNDAPKSSPDALQRRNSNFWLPVAKLLSLPTTLGLERKLL